MIRRDSPPKDGSSAPDARGLVAGILESVSAVVAMLAKRVILVSRKPRASEPRTPGRLGRPKKLLLSLTSLTHKKTAPFSDRWRRRRKSGEEEEEEYGDGGGVWQRGILMGDRCQPLEFSGAIYYDSNGKQLTELPPKSPRASPFRGFRSSRLIDG